MIFYLDGKHKIIRAGKKGTVLLTLATVVPRLYPGASRISRSVMPCVHCVSGSENSVATFVMNHTYKSVIKSLFKLDFNMRHICTDLSLALGCVAHVHPGLKTHYDQEHIRALAGSKSWQKKIDRVNRPIIASNMPMLCHCRTRVHHQNSIELMVKTWEDKEGMNENRIAAYVRNI